MPAYLVAFCASSRHADVVIEDDTLVVTVDATWAYLHDEHGLVLAVPRDQVASIQRVDEQPEE